MLVSLFYIGDCCFPHCQDGLLTWAIRRSLHWNWKNVTMEHLHTDGGSNRCGVNLWGQKGETASRPEQPHAFWTSPLSRWRNEEQTIICKYSVKLKSSKITDFMMFVTWSAAYAAPRSSNNAFQETNSMKIKKTVAFAGMGYEVVPRLEMPTKSMQPPYTKLI